MTRFESGGAAVLPPEHALNRIMSLGEALCSHHESDAHVALYRVAGFRFFARIKKGGLRSLLSAGMQPELTAVAVDVDNPGHQPIPHDHHPAQLEALAVRVLEAGFPFPALYATRAGARILWPLEVPLSITPETQNDIERRMAGLSQRLE